MKKIATTILIAIMATAFLSAAFKPTYDPVDSRIYSSPALLSEVEEKVTFGFMTDMGSDIDGFSFMANPVGALKKPAEYLASYLAGKDYDFWTGNSELRSLLEGMDENFPRYNELDPEIFQINVQSYFLNDFLSSEYGDERRAYIVSSSLSLVDAYPFDPSEIINGGTCIGLKLYGGNIKDNFGWDWNVNFRFDGASSLVNNLGSIFSIDARSNIGYAFDITERFSFGFSVQPMLRMETSIPNQNYLSARLSNSITALFTEDFRFGTGLSLNLGTMYEINDELKMLIDFRNMPSFRSYYALALTDLASFNLDFKEDKNIYFIPPDIAFRILWDRGAYHIDAEISDIVSQLVWNNLVPERDFNFYGVPKIRFTYDINEELSISSYLEHEMIAIAVDYMGIYGEINTHLDKGAIGIKFGYSF